MNAGGATRDEAAYKQPGQRGLRGRKVYPHHASLPAGYWSNPLSAQHITEYKRAGESDAVRDDQNRSIGGWVNIGTRYAARVAVMNLSAAELGALVWLLDLGPGYFHRIGGGKPLGFGSVRMTIRSLDLADGAVIKSRYAALAPGGRQDAGAPSLTLDQARDRLIPAFKTAVKDAYGASNRTSPTSKNDDGAFDEVRFIKSFLMAAKGLDGPVHYPAVRWRRPRLAKTTNGSSATMPARGVLRWRRSGRPRACRSSMRRANVQAGKAEGIGIATAT